MRNVITLMSGTVLSQLIPILFSPILSRIYTPSEMGLLAIVLSISSIISIVVTGRYEVAITLPKNNNTALHLLVLVLILSSACSSLLALVFVIYGDYLFLVFGSVPKLFLILVPIYGGALAIFQACILWLNRNAQYGSISRYRILQSASVIFFQVILGFLDFGGLGLVIGAMLGVLLSLILIISRIIRNEIDDISSITIRVLIDSLFRYSRFPRYSLAANTFNSISYQGPTLLIKYLFSSYSTGLYALTQRVVASPVTVIASAFGDVFRREASIVYSDKGNCTDLFDQTLKRLLMVSLIPFLIFIWLAPDLFSFIFGSEWLTSGHYARVLAPMYFFRFLSYPLSNMFVIAEKQHIDLYIHSVLFIVTIISFTIGYSLGSIMLSISIYSFSFSCAYAFCIYLSRRFSKGV